MVKDVFMVQINPNGQGGRMFSTCTLCVIKCPVTMHTVVAHFVRKVILFTLTAAFPPRLICSKPIHVGSRVPMYSIRYSTLYSALRHFYSLLFTGSLMNTKLFYPDTLTLSPSKLTLSWVSLDCTI